MKKNAYLTAGTPSLYFTYEELKPAMAQWERENTAVCILPMRN